MRRLSDFFSRCGNNTRHIATLSLCLLAACSAPAALASTPAADNAYIAANAALPLDIKQAVWTGSDKTGRMLTTYYRPGSSWHQSRSFGRPVAVYLQDLNIPRIGTATDEAIIEDLVNKGFIVARLNSSTLPTSSPEHENLLEELHKDLPNLLGQLLRNENLIFQSRPLNTDVSEVFYLPPGYTVQRSVPFWDLEKHGRHGALERILQVYNEHATQRFNVPPVESVYDIRNAKGEPLDFTLYLDIIHPAEPDPNGEGVPLIINFATQPHRMVSFRPGNSGQSRYQSGFTSAGYAWAIVDHCYIPLSRHENFGYFQPYTMEDHNGLAVATAAVRHFRTLKDQYGLNGKIGTIGHSKASFSVTRLLDSEHESMPEHSRYRDFPEGTPEPQPWPGFSSKIQAGMASMGNGTRRTRYINENTGPLLIAVGRRDPAKHWDVFPALVETADKAGINYVDLWMEDLSHSYPRGEDLGNGEQRYMLVRNFFDQILAPYGDTALKVYAITPREGATDVQLDGQYRVITAADPLPDDMKGISPYSPITVRFVRPIDPASMSGKLALKETRSGRAVEGEWSLSRQNTALSFKPAQSLKPATDYTLTVSAGIADTDGIATASETVRTFRTTASRN